MLTKAVTYPVITCPCCKSVMRLQQGWYSVLYNAYSRHHGVCEVSWMIIMNKHISTHQTLKTVKELRKEVKTAYKTYRLNIAMEEF